MVSSHDIVTGSYVQVFKFKPLEYVKVTYLGLAITGRIQRAIWSTSELPVYEVEYRNEMTIMSGTFREDELEAIQA